MIVPLILLLLWVAGLALALMVPGLSDLALLAGPMVAASLFLLIRAALRPRPAQPPETRGWRVKKPQAKWIVVDGSNVMHWADDTPRIEPLREVLAHLKAQGYAPGVVFDANAGYLVEGRYRHDGAFAKLLGLPEDRIMVVPKGTPADPMILTAARDLGARVVTNDRYRDWAGEYPEVRRAGFLVRGGYRDGRLWLDLETVAAG
jgi:hypothetical protein